MQKIILAAFAMAMLALADHVQAADIDFTYCTVCHGATLNGNAAIRAPKLAGLEPWYLRRQLHAFKAGWRGANQDDGHGTEMRPMALHLATDADIDKALTFVKRFESKTPPVTVRGNVERGKTLYQTCAACHGAAGEGNEQAHAPALAQRSDWYLARQLKSYRQGWRGSQAEDDLGVQMRAMALTLADDAAIQDVIAYIDTLSKP